jgi:predicted NodU family carbamoyl transferase
VLIAAAEEERFRRIKHWAGFPSEAIRYCLAEAGIRLGNMDVVAINQDAGANLWKKVAYTSVRALDPAHENGRAGAGGSGWWSGSDSGRRETGFMPSDCGDRKAA